MKPTRVFRRKIFHPHWNHTIMKMNRCGLIFSSLLLPFCLVLMSYNGDAQSGGPSPTGPYLGYPRPSLRPEMFAPGRISTPDNERDITFSPDGNEILFSIVEPRNAISAIVSIQKKKEGWSQPAVVSFSGRYSDIEPAFSPDGKRLFFASNRPMNDTGKPKDWDIWVVDRLPGGWSAPVNVGPPVNTAGDEFYPSVSRSGTLYFTSARDGGKGHEDIYAARTSAGGYLSPENLGDSVNSAFYEFNAFVHPDETLLIFTSYGREDDLGGGDLYVSFRKPGEQWSRAKHLAAPLNSPQLDYCPTVTRDSLLFFTSERTGRPDHRTKSLTYRDLRRESNDILNGFGNIYWVDLHAVIGVK